MKEGGGFHQHIAISVIWNRLKKCPTNCHSERSEESLHEQSEREILRMSERWNFHKMVSTLSFRVKRRRIQELSLEV